MGGKEGENCDTVCASTGNICDIFLMFEHNVDVDTSDKAKALFAKHGRTCRTAWMPKDVTFPLSHLAESASTRLSATSRGRAPALPTAAKQTFASAARQLLLSPPMTVPRAMAAYGVANAVT